MKKLLKLFFVLPFLIASVSTTKAQHDLVTMKTDNTHGDQCGFTMTIVNKNAAAKNVDEIQLSITSTNGAPAFINIPTFAHWNATFTDLDADILADNGGIAPNASLSGLGFAYTIDGDKVEPPIPVSVGWRTLNAGTPLDSGVLYPVCTLYQSYTQLDQVDVSPSQSGGDPCFTFNMHNKNSQLLDIYNVGFRLQNQVAGTLRPSKIIPAKDWILDSVTTYKAYFHTVTNPIPTGGVIGGWQVCLRANPAVKKFNFVWTAYDQANSLIDRDTVFDVANTATSSATDNDSLSVKAVSGCLYNVTLKNYHLSNLLPPSRIVRLVLKSKTAGVTFDAAPAAPAKWTKTVTPDSIAYQANSLSDGIPDGVASINQFAFSVTGATTTNFDIGWITYQAGATFPSQVSQLSTGTVTTKCTVAAKTDDIVNNVPGTNECDYKMTVNNVHNNKPASSLHTVAISIPAGSGQLLGITGPAGWNWSPAGTSINAKPNSASDDLLSGSSADYFYYFTPATSGTNVTATWTTTDDQGTVTGTGTFILNCAKVVTLCDTFKQSGSVSDDSCVKIFTLDNRRATAITHLEVSLTNGWLIDSSDVPSAAWVRQYVGTNQVNYDNAAGLAAGAKADFKMKFIRYYPKTDPPPPPDDFDVVALTKDAAGAVCNSISKVSPSCHAIPVDLGSVAQHSNDIGVKNFTIVPNPTRGAAEVSFEMSSTEHVELSVFDLLGNKVKTISNKLTAEGSYQIPYTMSNLPAGTYYVRMQTP
ncbi:MAG: T9SS type A sorting domain-containing protein, partial [Ignavibacteriota bacterium]